MSYQGLWRMKHLIVLVAFLVAAYGHSDSHVENNDHHSGNSNNLVCYSCSGNRAKCAASTTIVKCSGKGQFDCSTEYIQDGSQVLLGCLNRETCVNKQKKNSASCSAYNNSQTLTASSSCTFCCSTSKCNTVSAVDACLSNPCQNNAPCISNGGSSYTCQCPCGKTGTNCETDILRPCSSLPCRSGGSCYDNGTDYICQCPPGYSGRNCEHEPRPCGSQPCLNGGTCLSNGKLLLCLCKEGYFGDYCQHPPNPCASNPCQNDGECVRERRGYRCQCRQGYSGNNCEIIKHPCLSRPCQNGGQCICSGESSFECFCELGFTGQFCETDLTTTPWPLPTSAPTTPAPPGPSTPPAATTPPGKTTPPAPSTPPAATTPPAPSTPPAATTPPAPSTPPAATTPPGKTTPAVPTTTAAGTTTDAPTTTSASPSGTQPVGYTCESGSNPCTPENAASGLFYFPNPDPTKFVQCSAYGQCYVMSCGPGTTWNQQLLNCT